MVGWAGLPPSARQLLEPVSESNCQGLKPIEPIAWAADLAQANSARCCVHALGAESANPRRDGAPGLERILAVHFPLDGPILPAGAECPRSAQPGESGPAQAEQNGLA